ncbi:MAG: DUF523 domain-containing protein [Erysipelotrichaceae bacterium]
MKIIVSACLLGKNCKYDGSNNKDERLIELLKKDEVFPVCPEVMGGLPTPRACAEIVQNRVMNKEGKDVSNEYQSGAELCLALAKRENIDCAILQVRSPSCGKGLIYDGTFSGNKVKGNGIFAQLLLNNDFYVYCSDEYLNDAKNENIKD